jgi:hypothetical protein
VEPAEVFSICRIPLLSPLSYIASERNPDFCVMCLQGGYHGESTVVGRNYFTRQATILLKFAKSTNDPQLAAALIEKAADLKSQLDETMPPPDAGPQAPDVERPA